MDISSVLTLIFSPWDFWTLYSHDATHSFMPTELKTSLLPHTCTFNGLRISI